MIPIGTGQSFCLGPDLPFWPRIWTSTHIFVDLRGPRNIDDCAPISHHVFLRLFDFEGVGMQVYWLTDLQIGEITQVDRDTVERILGVEMYYVDWVLATDGHFENGSWRVQTREVLSERDEWS